MATRESMSTLEKSLGEMAAQMAREFSTQQKTMVAAVKALRAECLEREEKKKDEKEEKEDEKDLRRRRRLPGPLVPPTVPLPEQHFQQPTAASHKKHVYLVDGRMTTQLGIPSPEAAADGS